jgi:tRNA threonylcarbamoyl adenosine modification protein (Sua5/YciO/YrdC/YwlC family)
VSRTFDTADPHQRAGGLKAAAAAIRRGGLVVLPTDTVYGLAADAFGPESVAALLTAKGRGRDMPVPVLVASPTMLHGIADQIPAAGRSLVEAFWPGGLTVICRQQPSLAWDLGDADGTVAVRMPLHPVALELLRETGPLAVSSANRSGQPAATSAADARQQLGEQVEVYLEAGPTGGSIASSIVDVTADPPVLLRAGAVPLDALRDVVPGVVPPDPGSPGSPGSPGNAAGPDGPAPLSPPA